MMTYKLNDVRTLCALLCVLLRHVFGQHPECEETMMQEEEGIFSFRSNGEAKFCSLYIVAPVDKLVSLEFTEFDVRCQNDGAVGILDGWEVAEDFFPSDEDHERTRANRYIQFCGHRTPERRTYIAKQNVAQIQMFIANQGDGFTVSIVFITAQEPCNILLWGNSSTGITIKNYGHQRNCSALSLYIQEIAFSWFNVGLRRQNPYIFALQQGVDTEITNNCNNGNALDRIELYQGYGGMGEFERQLRYAFCGRRVINLPLPVTLACVSTFVRLVSSGHFHNSINFSLRPVPHTVSTC